VRFLPEAPQKRSNANVEAITVLAYDYDHTEPPWSLLDGIAYVATTTYKHRANDPECHGHADCPHWRVVIFLREEIPVAEHAEAWGRARFWLTPDADPSCKDPSRAYYFPVCQPGGERGVRRSDGALLDWRDLPAIPDEDAARQSSEPTSEPASSSPGERPGDRFNREATWEEILGPHGWQFIATLSDGSLRIRRPGKRDGHSATADGGSKRVLYVFTDEAEPFKERTSYTRFRAYSLLEHNGDDKAAARTLGERYGMNARRGPTVEGEWFSPPSKNGHPPPNGGNDEPADLHGQAPVGRMLTETGNAERLCDQHGRDLHFCHPWGQWLAWDGRRWRRDTTGTVRQWGKGVVRSIYAEAARIEDREIRAATAAFAKKSESAAGRAAMLKNAEVEPGIAIEPEQMDADGFLLNVLNGTVDLRTGQLRPHDRRDTITKLAPVVFDPQADCPTFLGFLERVLPDPDVRAFVRRFTGYGMTGDTSEQCLAFLHGGGANGKSTLLTILQAMLGDYARQTAPELLVSRGGDRHPTELADLFGARFVASVEVDEGKRLAETLVKQMTGGDRMKARFMRQDFFEWTPTHKLFLAANHRPEIRGTDYAIWRRIHLVPFTVTIPPAERDGKLPTKLLAELPGILNWAIAGCLDWQRNGLGVPQAVRDATDAYRAEQDILADFLAERCVIDPQAWAEAGSLYKAYTEWCDAGGLKPVTGTAFGTRLSERGHRVDRRPVGAKRVRVRLGLRLLGPGESPNPDGFAPPDGLGHDFPHGSYPGARESDIPENPSNPSGAPNPSGEGDVIPCATCGGNAVDLFGLECDECMGVAS